MKTFNFFVLFVLCSSLLVPQNILEKHDETQTLTEQQCYDVIKTVWDGLKKLSEGYEEESSQKSEFESTAEFNARLRKNKDDFITKIAKFYSDNKLNSTSYSVWMKAELVKYDADNQTYGIKSPTQILIQPKKKDITVTCPPNKYVIITEKNSGGYRSAYLHLATNPEFTWFVTKQTAQEAKNKEAYIYFKMSFKFDISFDELANQIVLQISPSKLSLMDQSASFTYWSEDIR